MQCMLLTAACHRVTADHDALPPSTIQIQSQLSNAEQRVLGLEKTYEDQIKLQSLYEDTLADATDRIRQYCFEQQQHIKGLHEHYLALLQQSRWETIECQMQHQQWQGGLTRLSEGVREALKV